MNVLLAIGLLVVAVGGGAVALTEDPLRQTFVLAIFGLGLTFLFFVLQAPDVALSEITVGTVGLPIIVIAALRKIAEQERTTQHEDDER